MIRQIAGADGESRGAAVSASASGFIPGDHGHPGARHVPFVILGREAGAKVKDQTIAPSGTVNEGDDNRGESRPGRGGRQKP